MSNRSFQNIYGLSDQQLEDLDKAEEMLELQHLNSAEELLLEMLKDSPECIPVLNNLGVLYGKYFLEYEKAIKEIFRVLKKGGIAIVQTPFSKKIKNHF